MVNVEGFCVNLLAGEELANCDWYAFPVKINLAVRESLFINDVAELGRQGKQSRIALIRHSVVRIRCLLRHRIVNV